MPNDKWRPFSLKSSKAARREKESCDQHPGVELPESYKASQGTINQVYSISSRFFEHLVEDGAAATNPFRMIKKKGQNRSTPQEEGAHRALTPLQWDYVLETAEQMALTEPERHERTLFIVATLFAMYLRVSDIVGRPNWHPIMGDFRQDEEGNWWYHVIGKGNKAGKIAVRDEYVTKYLGAIGVSLACPSCHSGRKRHPCSLRCAADQVFQDDRCAPSSRLFLITRCLGCEMKTERSTS